MQRTLSKTGKTRWRITLDVTTAVIRAHRLLFVLASFISLASLVLDFLTKQGNAPWVWNFVIFALTLALSSFIHEELHACIAIMDANVDAIRIETTLFRMSVEIYGYISKRRLILSALAGPSAGMALALFAWFLFPPVPTWIIVIMHFYALTPWAGDGRALWSSLCGR